MPLVSSLYSGCSGRRQASSPVALAGRRDLAAPARRRWRSAPRRSSRARSGRRRSASPGRRSGRRPARDAVGERVGEDQPALGVGVVDLDGLAVELGDDVAGLVARARRACSRSRGCTAIRLSGRSSSAIAPTASSTAAPPDMSIFISSISADGLDRDAAGVEGDAPCRPGPAVWPVAAARRSAGRSAAAPRRCPWRRPPGRPSRAAAISSRPDDLDRDRLVRGGELLAPARRGRSGWRRSTGRFCSSRARFGGLGGDRARPRRPRHRRASSPRPAVRRSSAGRRLVGLAAT